MAGTTRRWVVVGLITALLGLVVAASPALADESRERRDQSIIIKSDDQFTAANGVRSGTGTESDPYVISGWDIFDIRISDTSKYLRIENNTIDRLVLNWNGDRVTVVNNDIGDLRVNQNVKRTGGPTSGLIADNRFGVVGQLRHFDGIFTRNIVGRSGSSSSLPFFTNRAVNFDGFHGSRFFDNTLYGYLEVRLHGHHHGSSYDADSHYHGAAPSHHHGSHGEHAEMTDHTKRYHRVFVYDNTIHADGPYALIYTDSNHRGNDRTAASETNPDLNKPHTHWTKVHLTDNKLVGAGLTIDIFNARDQSHTATNRGAVEIARNDITVTRDERSEPWYGLDGIEVRSAVDLDLQIMDNTVSYEPSGDLVTTTTSRFNRGAGISLYDLDKADVLIGRNTVTGFFYGVSARYMSESVFWRIISLQTDGVSERISYDSSVKNKPQESP